MIKIKERVIFIKGREKPIALRKIDAAISRLVASCSKLPQLRKKAAQLQKGYNGERKLDYHLRSVSDAFAIVNDVTLCIFSKQFQIDSLIISAHAIYIVEVKSYEGTVMFNTLLKQFNRNNGEKLQGFKYPISQVETIHFHLLRWLEQRNLGGLPIYYFIAFSEQSTIIQVDGDEKAISKVVSYVDEIPLRMMKLNTELANLKQANNQLKNRIVRTVMHECVTFKYDVFKEFGISKQDIQPGVHCPACGTLRMGRHHGKWRCKECGNISKDAHLKALYDYHVLFNDTITNKQCRYFLGVDSRHAVKKILMKNATLKKGTQKWILNVK